MLSKQVCVFLSTILILSFHNLMLLFNQTANELWEPPSATILKCIFYTHFGILEMHQLMKDPCPHLSVEPSETYVWFKEIDHNLFL